MIPADALYRLVRALVDAARQYDEVTQAQEGDRDWLVLERMSSDLPDIQDVATLARVISGEGVDHGTFPIPGGYVATIHHVDRVFDERA